MNEISVTLNYVAHLTMLTGCLAENYLTAAATLRQLVQELDGRYLGFAEMVIDTRSGRLCFNAAIYYTNPGEVPVSVVDLDHRLQDGARLTFW
jgi:hypothetical protein